MGLKSIPIEAFPPSYWRVLEGKLDESGPISATHAYRNVPVMRSAIELRAHAVSNLPYIIMQGDEDVSLKPEIVAFMRTLRPLLRKIELNLCLFGCAYLLIERNRYGLNGKLRSILPNTISPIYDTNEGLVGFKRVVGNKEYKLSTKDVIYFWMDNVEAEVGPGPAPAETALRSASTLYFLDTFLQNFWSRGAIKATLLSVNGPTQQSEMEKLENWWKRFMSGVKNSWNTVAIRSDIKPVVVGDTLKDTVNPDLTEQSRTDTLTAFGVPHSLVLSNAATYATANVDRLAFYEDTVVPQAQMICDAINEQLLDRANLRIVPRPDKLETYQRNELDKAQGVIQLTGSPILTVNEARDMMGYGPIDQAPMNIDDKFDQPEEIINATAPKVIDETPEPVSTVPEKLTKSLDTTASLDLNRWKAKAIKSVKAGRSADVRFDSTDIPYTDSCHLKQLLSEADCTDAVSHIFKAFKASPGTSLTPDEQELYDILARAMAKIRRDAERQGTKLSPDEFAQRLGREVAAALNLSLTSVYQQLIQEAVSATGIGIDPLDLTLRLAPEWDTYVRDRGKQIEDTTRRYLMAIINGGIISNDALFDIPFGLRRAEIIAVTETTNAKAMVMMAIQKILAEQGVQTQLIWVTAQDELVCAKCRPLNGQAQGVWQAPPPAHPYCRCTLRLEVV